MINRNVFIGVLVLLGLMVFLPAADNAYLLRLGTMACMYAVMAVSWTIIGGFAGYPSFATAAFFGLGAYANGVLVAAGASLATGMTVALVLALALGLSLGAVLLRLRGHYFAIASLAVAEVLRELTNAATELTGGGMGLNVPISMGGDIMDAAAIFYWGMWALLIVTLALVLLLERSKLGFGLKCIKQNEMAADMIGVNSTLYKSVAFALSGAFVALAGALYAAWVNYIEPPDVFDILYSVKPIVMALLGGLGSAVGAVLGAFVFLGIEELVWRHFLEMHAAVLGLLIVLLLLFLPNGLVSLLRARARRHVEVRHG